MVAGRAIALALGVLALAVPAAMAAATTSTPLNLPGGTSPFSPGVPVSPVTTTSSTTTPVVVSTSSSSGGGLSGSDAILIAVGAVIVLVGVSAFIWRDARRHAPARGAGAASSANILDGARSGSKAPPKPRKLSPAERKRRKRGRAR